MKWDWRKSFKLNFAKIIGHHAIEYSWLGGWYLALEGDPIFWPIGIIGAIIIHFIVFSVLDIFHDHHHHHKGEENGHAHHTHKQIAYRFSDLCIAKEHMKCKKIYYKTGACVVVTCGCPCHFRAD